MTRVSRHKLKENQLQEITDHFIHLVSTLKNSKEIENFLSEFLTKEEKLMLAKRLVLQMMIQKGYTTPAIQESLHVSYETVRNYTNQLEMRNNLFKKTVVRLVKRQKAREFWNKIDKFLKPAGLALQSKTNMKARAKIYSGNWS
jgi:uncharacterized protein YerC